MPNTKDRGDKTESAIIHKFISEGYSVSIPFGDNDKYDIIVDSDDRLYRVQCKTAWQNKDDTIRFNTHSQTTKDGEYHEDTYDGEIDAFAVRYPKTDAIYWIPISEATAQKMELRFATDSNHPRINWAEDYKFDSSFPSRQQ